MTRPCPIAPLPTKPSFAMPKGAWDTHVHVMGPYDKYPMSEDRLYTSDEVPLSALVTMLDAMGLSHVVVAHPSAFGSDLRVTLDSVQQLKGRSFGTIPLDPHSATREDVREFHRLGIRGVRLAKSLGWDATTDELRAIADRIVEFDWHISIWPSDVAELEQMRKLAETTGVRIVLDHLAGHCWDAKKGTDQEGFAQVLDMLKSNLAWLKVSGMYRVSQERAPWPELLPFGRKLAAECTQRLLWASDWPHIGLFTDNMPQSHEVLKWLVDIGCDTIARQQILVENPRHFYGMN
jgi:2-pyrone-4,6-dicarboxylate lactonase